MDAQIPMGYFMVEAQDQTTYAEMVTEIARRTRGKINWIWLDL
jgi:hypothetical protein